MTFGKTKERLPTEQGQLFRRVQYPYASDNQCSAAVSEPFHTVALQYVPNYDPQPCCRLALPNGLTRRRPELRLGSTVEYQAGLRLLS